MRKTDLFCLRPIIILALSLTIILSGCREVDDVVYSEFSIIDPDGWDPVETLEFSSFPADSATFDNTLYDLRIMVRYDRSFSNRIIPLFVEQTVDGNVIERDSVSLVLYDDKGDPTGKGSLGVFERFTILEHDMPLKEGYSVTLSPLLNKQDSKGILNVGVSLKRSSSL